MCFKPWFLCYAPIDLKNAIILIQDGFGVTPAGGLSETPKVDGNPALNATTIGLTQMNVKVPVGGRFTVPGSTKKYQITGRVLKTGNTNEIQTVTITGSPTGGTFTLSFKGQTTAGIAFNATAAAVQSALEALSTIGAGNVLGGGGPLPGTPVTVTFQGTLVSKDVELMTANSAGLTGGTSPTATPTETMRGGADQKTTTSITFTPGLDVDLVGGEAVTFLQVQLEVNVGEGNAQYTESREIETFRNRGKLDTVREGDEQPVEVSLEFIWDFLRSLPGATTPTVEEAVKGIGPASEWYSSSQDACEPYAVDIVIEQQPDVNCASTLGKETITLEDFRFTSLDHNADDGQVSLSGESNRTQATVVRTTS